MHPCHGVHTRQQLNCEFKEGSLNLDVLIYKCVFLEASRAHR